MKKQSQIVLVLIYVCANLAACKLDPPILPGDKDYVATEYNTVPGTTGSTGTTGTTGTTNTAALTGTWKVSKTSLIALNSSGGTLSQVTSMVDFFDKVTLNDATKTCDVFSAITSANPKSYTATITNGKLYIKFAADLFGFSSNTQIAVTGLSSTAMTWTATDPQGINAGGQVIYSGYIVQFTK